MQQQLLGVDWGTSNRRAYLLDKQERPQATYEDDQGMLSVRGRFPEALAELIARMQVSPGVPVVMSGMVGSANGWREVPYLDISAPLEHLPRHLVRVEGHGLARECMIVPGYCQREGGIDVMRGEETQLLGAVSLGWRDGWVVLPGTHSKWVLLRDGVIEQVSTYMTGELFASLAAGGTLAPLLAGGDCDEAFDAGVREARLRAPLTNSLFRVRARVVSGAMPAAHARSFVSGLLVGTEFAAATVGADGAPVPVALVCSPALLPVYVRAAGLFGISTEQLDPHRVYTTALSHFFEAIP